MYDTETKTLEDYADANWLEDNRRAARYAISGEDSLWFCHACGCVMEDETEPCQECEHDG
jgi:rubrerythrin